MLKKTCLTIAFVGCASPLLAAESEQDGVEISIGLMGGQMQSPYLGGEDQSFVFPMLDISWGPLFFRGGTLGTFIYGDENFAIAAGISPDFIADKDRGDSKLLSDMTELDTVINGTLLMIYQSDFGEFELKYDADISDKHDGNVVSLSYSYPMQFNRFEFRPYFGVQKVSEEVNQYYYGVSQADVINTREFYMPEAGVNYNAGLSTIYSINAHHNIMFDVAGTFYSDEIKDSPIVDDSSSLSVSLGYFYRF